MAAAALAVPSGDAGPLVAASSGRRSKLRRFLSNLLLGAPSKPRSGGGYPDQADQSLSSVRSERTSSVLIPVGSTSQASVLERESGSRACDDDWAHLPQEILSVIVAFAWREATDVQTRRNLRAVSRNWKAAADEVVTGVTLDRTLAKQHTQHLQKWVADREDLTAVEKRREVVGVMRKMMIKPGTLNSVSLSRFVAHSPQLTSLRVDVPTRWVDAASLAALVNLRALKLVLAWGVKESAKQVLSLASDMRKRSALISVIAALPQLETLDLSKSTGIVLPGYWKTLSQCARLRKLVLKTVRVPESTIRQIIKISTLRELDIPYADVDQVGEVDTFLTDLSCALPDLERLNLMWLGSSQGFCDSKLKEYMHLRDIKTLTKLRSLEIGSCDHLTDTHFDHLSTLTSLEHLSMAHNSWAPWPIVGFCFQFMPTLRTVHLHNFQYVNDQGVIGLTQWCPNLEDFYLDSASKITMRSFAALQNTPLLRRLVLVGAHLKEEEMAPILELLEYLVFKSPALVTPRHPPADFICKFVDEAR